MKGFVNLRYFFDERIFRDEELPIVPAELSGKYSKTVSDETIKRYESALDENLISTSRSDDGIAVKTQDRNDENIYNYTWGDFGYYYDFQDVISYVKSEQLMRHLSKKFGDEYREAYMDFCRKLLGEIKFNHLMPMELKNSTNKNTPHKKVSEKYIDSLLSEKLKLIMDEFDEIIGKKSLREKPVQFGEN